LLKQIRHVKGKRIIFLMPLNGQRTHTNGQTVKYLLLKIKYRILKKLSFNRRRGRMLKGVV